jgi:glycosyltransferase involved in cell wall biosynthesis
LLYPIQYPEAFGMVLVEAMLCGTPVAAVQLGAVPEIVDHGVTGMLAEGLAAFLPAVKAALGLDRAAIRARAEGRFSSAQMARSYAQLYERVCAAQPA